ncbi:hypothetical protein KIW84_060821 [Lathyrus oleraceus]|uniref:Uncharacterized protein n=1 Tax=Pisum sativum TaxID=3888 RepID=A0A9D5A3B6_PEA|nr:hypothetical protein KIW84_060821 [Pisum sativum]
MNQVLIQHTAASINPYYVVRYNSENDIPAGVQGGTTLVSCVPEFADRVLNKNKDLYRKGYDGSGPNDEELSDEVEFSDDEKEAEYRKMQRMTKRGNSDQNLGRRRNNKNKFSLKEMVPPTLPNASTATHHVLHTAPNAPAVAPLVNHGNRSSFLGTGQGGITTVSPFQPLNAGPNFAVNAMWANQTTFPQQSQLSLLPNAFLTNAMSYYPQNTQFSHQFPVRGEFTTVEKVKGLLAAASTEQAQSSLLDTFSTVYPNNVEGLLEEGISAVTNCSGLIEDVDHQSKVKSAHALFIFSGMF